MSDTRVRAIIVLDGKLLCVKNTSSADFWCLPGGKVDNGEDIESALIREMTEETGIVPQLGRLVYVHQFKQNDQFGLPEFFFEVVNAEDYATIDLSATSHGEQELLAIDFIDVQSANIRPDFLKHDLAQIIAEDFNGPTRVRIID